MGTRDLYWIEWPRLWSAPAAGGEPRLLAGLKGTEYRIVPTGDVVYVQDLEREAIYRVQNSVGPPPRKMSRSTGTARFPTTQGAQVYWVAEGGIWTMGSVDGSPKVVARTRAVASGLAVDDRHVYFAGAEWCDLARRGRRSRA